VEGLADLPIRDMLDRLKGELTGSKETAGQLVWESGEEKVRATWAWQFMRLDTDHLADDRRDQLFDLARSVGCAVFDPQMNLKMQ
jgi:hypothetical protein